MAEATLTVTIHKTKKRVLWAESDKDFVDFLFCLFSIPMGQVLNLLNDHESMGCLRKLYQSVDAMEKDFMVCDKDDILQPKVHLISSIPCLLKLEANSIAAPYTTLDLYTCLSECDTYSALYGHLCQTCKHPQSWPVVHYAPNSNPASLNEIGNGFVKGGAIKYIVTDDLSVTSKCKELMKMVLTSNPMVLTNLFKEEVGF